MVESNGRDGNHVYAIEANQLTRVYKVGPQKEVLALRGVSLQVNPGGFMALKGRWAAARRRC